MKPRRLSLQLTPLFDLMLIVIFAQYLSMRVEEARRDTNAAQLQATHDEAVAQRDRMALDLATSEARQQSLAQAVVQMFQIPELDVLAALNAAQRTPEERRGLEQRFAELAQSNAADTIEHIVTYDEIRKRCDLWNLHLDGNGALLLQVNEAPPQPVLGVSSQGLTPQQLEAELFAHYKSQPEQKSLVLILLTYDRSTRLILMRQVRDLLPSITARMQQDSGGRTRYDFADLGFRAE